MLMEMPDDGAFRLVGNLEALQFKVVEGMEILIDSVHPQTPDHSIADHPPHAPQYSAPEVRPCPPPYIDAHHTCISVRSMASGLHNM